MVHERNKLCDICGCSVRGIFKLLFELFIDEMFRKFEERNPKIKKPIGDFCLFINLIIFQQKMKQ